MNDQPVTHELTGFPAAAVRFVRALERNREAIAIDRGLSPSEMRALFWIAERGTVRPKDLAEHMEMTTGGVTAIAQSLVQTGLLARTAHPSDRRSLHLELTDEGHEVMVEMHADFLGMIADSTSSLTSAQLVEFESALTTVADEVFRHTAL